MTVSSVSSSSGQTTVSNHEETTSPPTPSEGPPVTPSNLFPRSLSAPSSRTSSFSSGLDQLAIINQSAHTFPANVPSTSTDSSYHTLSPSSHIRAARSTPNSPRLGLASLQHQERRSISRPSSPSSSRRSSGSGHGSLHSISADEPWRVRRKRARSWVNTPGAGFTPTTAIDHHSRTGHGGMASRSTRSQRHASTSETNFVALDARTYDNARLRSTSASGSVDSTNVAEQPGRSRQTSLSARASPVMSPLHPLTPMEAMAPHRTLSVPHLARISPLIYGYSYQYPQSGSRSDRSEMATVMDGYFALPPPSDSIPPNISPLDFEEMPPPYTASQIDLPALSNGNDIRNGQLNSHITNLRNDNDDDDAVLSFSTMRRENRGEQRSDRDGLRQRHHDDSEIDEVRMPRDNNSIETYRKEEERTTTTAKMHSCILLYMLHPLRLLAALPGCIGTFWLLRNAFLVLWINGTIWQEDNRPGALEFGLASLWSLSTAYHALSFTTLLLRRWLHYYSILPSFIRLIALQAICWPLVRTTLYIVGPNNPLASWMIIATTTAFSDTVARWVVSNITDEVSMPRERSNSLSTLHRDHRKRQRQRRTGTAFWRAVMGGPSENNENDRMRPRRSAFTESEADSDNDFVRSQRGARRQSSMYTNGFQSDITSGGEDSLIEQERLVRSQRVVRIFHWDVALQRNILPIAILAYLSLGAMLLEQVRQRA